MAGVRAGGGMPSVDHDELRDYGFADKALALRQRAGLTQRDLATLLGVSVRAIGAWEAGLSYPGTERLKQLIALYVERGAFGAGRGEEGSPARRGGKPARGARGAGAWGPGSGGVSWRGLGNAPPVLEWLAGAIAALSAAQALPPDGLEARLGLLLELLRTQRGLLVLDNLETVLEPEAPAVRYRAGYDGYGETLRRLGASAHQGCLLVTTPHQPLPA